MNTKTLLTLSALALGLLPMGLPARADDMSGMDMGGAKTSRTSKPAALSVTTTVNPAAPRMGDNALNLLVTDASGKPVTGLKLTTTVAMTSMDMGTTHPALTDQGGGHYAASVAFAMDGPWRVVVRNGGNKIAVLDFNAGAKTPWKSPVPAAAAAKAMAGMDMGGNAADTKPIKSDNMAGMDMGGNKDAMPGMDMSGKKADTGGMAGMKTGIADMKTAVIPHLQEMGTYVATGDEDWKMQTGFGHNAPMVAMMNRMMVGGSGGEGMKMAPMKMSFGEANYAKPTSDAADSGGGMAGMDMGGNTTDSAKTAANPPAAQPGAPAGDAKAIPGMTMAAPPVGSTAPSSAPSPITVTATIASAPKAGDNPLTIHVTDAQGKPVTGAKITTTVAMTSMEMGTTHPAVKEMGNGKYAATVTFGMAGPWRVKVNVITPGRKAQTKAFDFAAR